MEFLARNLNVTIGETEKNLAKSSVVMHLETISREKGVVGKYESKPVEVEAGGTYSASRWITTGDSRAPGFGDRRKITLGQLVVINHEEQYLPRECEGATHAVGITVASDHEMGLRKKPGRHGLCLTVEG